MVRPFRPDGASRSASARVLIAAWPHLLARDVVFRSPFFDLTRDREREPAYRWRFTEPLHATAQSGTLADVESLPRRGTGARPAGTARLAGISRGAAAGHRRRFADASRRARRHGGFGVSRRRRPVGGAPGGAIPGGTGARRVPGPIADRPGRHGQRLAR